MEGFLADRPYRLKLLSIIESDKHSNHDATSADVLHFR